MIKKILYSNPFIKSVTLFLLGEVFNKSIPFEIKKMRILARSNFVRNRMIKKYNKIAVPDLSALNKSIFTPVKSEEQVVKELSQNGFSLGFSLSDESVNKILDYCRVADFKINMNPKNTTKVPVDQNPPMPQGNHYSLSNPHTSCEEIMNLCRDPFILGMATKYLGQAPQLQRTDLWWTYPIVGGNALGANEFGFHYDLGDYKSVFAYLSDVDENGGPHVIIKGTNGNRNFFEKLNRRIDDVQAEKIYGKEAITYMYGKKGEAFFSDPFAYHKGTEPKTRRLIFQITYSVSNIVREEMEKGFIA